MMIRMLTALILSLLTGYQLLSQPQPTAILEIEFTGIRNTEGLIAVGINHSLKGWPRKPHYEYSWSKETMKEGTLVVRINNLSYGTYAISVVDDVNSNLEMEMFLGIPREGWGFSNNPPFRLVIPKFEECSLEVDQPFQRISIEMRYIGKGD
jgi:uncharacterized protein (DUF2141 family)